jgi:uroporphyrinogen-III synthase
MVGQRPKSRLSPDELEAAADQAIAACGGITREAVKALLIANDFLESQISEGYVRGVKHGRFHTYSG